MNPPIASERLDVGTLARFEPLSALAAASLDKLARIAHRHPIARGDDVLTGGNWKGRIVYLLCGELKIE